MSDLKIDTFEVLDLREKFFKTSNSIFELGLDYGDIAVYCLLCRLSNNSTMKSYPSITYIQKSLKMSRAKVISCINNLSQSHVILKKKYGKGLNSVYLLVNLSPIPNPKETLSGPKEVLPSPKQILPSPKEVLDKDLVLKDLVKKTNTTTEKKQLNPNLLNNLLEIHWGYILGGCPGSAMMINFRKNFMPLIKAKPKYEQSLCIKALVEYRMSDGGYYFSKYPNIPTKSFNEIIKQASINLFQDYFSMCNRDQKRLYFNFSDRSDKWLETKTGGMDEYIKAVEAVISA